MSDHMTMADAARRVDDAIDLYVNPDRVMRSRAIDALLNSRHAFWTTAPVNRGKVRRIACCHYNNETFRTALDRAYRIDDKKIKALDTVVPLDGMSAINLSFAYAQFGIFCDPFDLEIRRLRHCGK